jgi:hypothetical protein
VQLVGAEKLQAKLGRVLEPIEQGLAQLAEYVRQEAKRRAKPHSWNKGTLGNAVKVSFAGKGMALSATVAPPKATMGIAYTIEEGRRPGKPPSVKAIGRWAKAGGITTKPWLLAQYIKKHGTKGIHFMAGAAEAGEKKAHDICQAAAIKIEENWGK